MNILTSTFNTVHNTAPFSLIENDDYIPAFDLSIQKTRQEIEAIASNPELPNFENTIEALAFSGMELERIQNIFFNLHSANTNDQLDQIAQNIAPKLSELSNDITLNFPLFKRIKSVYDSRGELTLIPEQDTLLNKYYKDFVRNGALLP
ncbi:MAG: M3 family metallopeptidase, partial [Sphingobacterium sp.]